MWFLSFGEVCSLWLGLCPNASFVVRSRRPEVFQKRASAVDEAERNSREDKEQALRRFVEQNYTLLFVFFT